MAKDNVAIHVLSFNDEDTIKNCIESALTQKIPSKYAGLTIRVLDNDSKDNTFKILQEKFQDKIILEKSEQNLGFSGGHNHMLAKAIKESNSYIFVLNPDVRLETDTLSKLLETISEEPRAGMACPKLLRADSSLNPVTPPRFDSTGMYITPATRHFDRGSEQLDEGQFDTSEFVFGASGAAVLLKREFVVDCSLNQKNNSQNKNSIELFDDSFFAYREDADLSWRAQIFGWKCLYIPSAKCYHQRVVLPERRKTLPKKLNSMSVRNRFLLLFNNFSLLHTPNAILPTAWRNLLVIGAVCSIERSSFEALPQAIKLIPSSLKKRAFIFSKKRVSRTYIRKWFSNTPHSEPYLQQSKKIKKIKDCRITVINYNSEDLLEKCLTSIESSIQDSTRAFKVCIVDNKSQDESARKLVSKFKNFDFQLMSKNLGFAGAIEHSASLGKEQSILILNPDITLDKDSLEKLISQLEIYPQLGAIAPVLLNPDDSPQEGFSARSFPSICSTVFELFGIHKLFPKNEITRSYLKTNDIFFKDFLHQNSDSPKLPFESQDKPLIVEQPAGASLLIRRKAFDEINGFDTSFWPAWFEDVDFCKRLKDKDWLCAIDSKARVTHLGGYSLEQLGKAAFFEIWYPNLIHYWNKHGSNLELVTLKVFLIISLSLKALLFYSKSLISGSSQEKEIASSMKRCLFKIVSQKP